jgi:hypothetical protein
LLSAVKPRIESQQVPLRADHQRAAKFTGLDDFNYIRISECLETMSEAIASKQPQQTHESVRSTGMNKTGTGGPNHDVIWGPVDTGDRVSSPQKGHITGYRC